MRLSGMLWIVVVGVAACSSYVGTTRDADNGDISNTDAAQDVAVVEAASGDGPRPICGSGLGECDPVAGTGCPSGQHCAISGVTSLVVSCIDDGAAAPGEACVGPADCGAGLQCISSRCLRLCCTRSDDATCRTGPASSSSACGISLETTGGVSFRACTATGICDWLTQQGCGPNQICLPSTAFGDGRCALAGEGLLGQPCVEGNACVRGLFCAAPSGSPTARRCALICDPRLMDCAGGRICRQVQGYPGNFGACL